jgi:hypothetical protein
LQATEVELGYMLRHLLVADGQIAALATGKADVDP